MDKRKPNNQKYNIQIEQAQASVIGDNNTVTRHFYLPPPAPLLTTDILTSFYQANAALRNYPHTIANIHIPRDETQQIVEWVQEVDTKENLAVLLEQPGSGKTVVLHDILVELESIQIPILAIKADALPTIKNKNDLSGHLGLPASVEECIDALTAKVELVVIILDQIDALSVALLHDQSAINVMLGLLNRLRANENVRIVVSCREFELNNDPRLSKINAKKTFQLKPLNADQIRTVFQSTSITYTQLLPAHHQILRLPLHLQIYARLAESVPDHCQVGGYRTLQDLYDALWNQQIISRNRDESKPQDRIEVIYALVDSMQENQCLSAPVAMLDAHPSAGSYLERIAFIQRKGGTCSFFHQTLFDYCYARRFVANGRVLSDEILSGSQGLFEHSQMVQILAYLRGVDEKRYQLCHWNGCSMIFFHKSLIFRILVGSDIFELVRFPLGEELITTFWLTAPV